MPESAQEVDESLKPGDDRTIRPAGEDVARSVPRPAATSGAEQSATARFASVLFPPGRDEATPDRADEPGYFTDVNLDQIVAHVVDGRGQYNLTPLFRVRVDNLGTIAWRHAVFHDLERQQTYEAVAGFAKHLDATRKRLTRASKLHDHQQKLRWILNGLVSYLTAVEQFAAAITAAEPSSPGLTGLADYVHRYRAGSAFDNLAVGARGLLDELAAIRYDLLIRGTKITAGNYDDEADYSAQVLATFERFRQGDVTDHRVELRTGAEMDSIEAAVLGLVAQLHPELFGRLQAFCTEHRDFLDPVIARADRELQFYLAWLDHIAPIRRAGLDVTCPHMTDEDKQLHASGTFDIALADKLLGGGSSVVTNDVTLTGKERILVVSGPNQGGKTTLARTVGQLYHLASLGCPIPGSDIRLHLPDAVYSHFEREEHLETLSGKLEDEVIRIRDILAAATGNSVVIMNEMFNSTTVADARILSERVLHSLSDLDAVCLCVTFIDELSRLNDKTVSMVSTVDEDDPAVRTFRVVRTAADGRAYALAIANKYHLTFDRLRDRVEAHA